MHWTKYHGQKGTQDYSYKAWEKQQATTIASYFAGLGRGKGGVGGGGGGDCKWQA